MLHFLYSAGHFFGDTGMASRDYYFFSSKPLNNIHHLFFIVMTVRITFSL